MTEAEEKKVTRLLKTVRGQLDGLLRMVKEGRSCPEISAQLLAAEAILRRANREVLQVQLNEAVREAVEGGSQEEKISEIIAMLEKVNR